MLKKIIKKIYSLIPNFIKKSVFQFIKFFYIPNHKIFQHLHFRGFFKIKFEGKSGYIFLIPTIYDVAIFWGGIENSHEPLSLKIWFYLSKTSTQIIDGGSNAGIFSFVAHLANKNSIIHSFDPSTKFIETQKKIKIKNNMDLLINNVALGELNEIVYYDGFRIHKKNRGSDVEVNTIKLSDYIKEKKINRVDLIKLDLEHFEPYVIKDMKNIIEKDMPNMLIEILTDSAALKIRDLLKNCLYEIFLINDKNKKIRKSSKIENPYHFKLDINERLGATSLWGTQRWNVLLLNQSSSKAFVNNFSNFLVN